MINIVNNMAGRYEQVLKARNSWSQIIFLVQSKVLLQIQYMEILITYRYILLIPIYYRTTF